MSIVDEGNRIVRERLTGQTRRKKKKATTSINDIDPAYGLKDTKAQTLDRMEDHLIDINENLKEIVTLLTAIKNKKTGRTISV